MKSLFYIPVQTVDKSGTIKNVSMAIIAKSLEEAMNKAKVYGTVGKAPTNSYPVSKDW